MVWVLGSTPASDGAVTDAFSAWLDQQSITRPKCKLAMLPHTGRGVVATSTIEAGEVVVEIPDDAVLLADVSVVAGSLGAAGLERGECPPLYEAQALVIAVMAEKLRGEESLWAPYLAALPLSFPGMPFTWPKSERRMLVGTSTLELEEALPAGVPPSCVQTLFDDLVFPFFHEFPGYGAPRDRDALFTLYTWATAAVAAYSFELGDEDIPAMVPFWDMLNHVTGAVNVRLHHDAKRGALQMIATTRISAHSELINSYGDLSNGDLLRRHGFIERSVTPAGDLAALVSACGVANSSPDLGALAGAVSLWRCPNPHDAALLPVFTLVRIALDAGLVGGSHLLRAKLAFLSQFGLIPDSRRFTVAADGTLQPEAAETARILCLSAASFGGFADSVVAWAPGRPRPLAALPPSHLSAALVSRWRALVLTALDERRAALVMPTRLYSAIQKAPKDSQQRARLEAALTVGLGEWCAIAACMHRLGTEGDAGSEPVPTHDAQMHARKDGKAARTSGYATPSSGGCAASANVECSIHASKAPVHGINGLLLQCQQWWAEVREEEAALRGGHDHQHHHH